MKFVSSSLYAVFVCCIVIGLPSTVDAAEYRYGRLDPFHSRTPLPSASIRSVGFDGLGVAWFTIYSSGLARYTGEELTVYGPESGISSVAVRELAIDHRGFIWVGSDKGLSVSRLSTKSLKLSNEMTFQTQIGDVQLEQKNIVSGPFWHEKTGRVYVLTAHELIGYQWSDGGKVKVYRRAVDEVGVHGFRTGQDLIWLFARHKVIGTSDPFSDDETVSVATSCERVTASYRLGNDHWVGCRGGDLWRRNVDATSEWGHYGNYEEIYSLTPDQENLLAATRLGVILFRANGDIERFDKDTGLNNSELRSVVISEHGGMWFAGSNGLTSLPKDFRRMVSVSSWRESDSLVREVKDNLLLRELQTIPQSLLLGGTDLVWADYESLERIGILELAQGERAWIACENPVDKSLWVSTTSELLQITESNPPRQRAAGEPTLQIRDKDYKVKKIPFGRGNGCTAYQSDVSHGVCFSQPEEVLCSDSVAGIRRFSEKSGLPKSSSQALELDNQGHLWVGSFSSGLFRSSVPVSELNRANSSFRFEIVSDYRLVTTNVESILWRGEELFLATDQGLVVYERGRSDPKLHLDEGTGLGDNYIYTLALDGEDIWVGGNKGARKVNLVSKSVVDVLDRGSGLPDQEMPWHQAIAHLSDGRIGLATSSGFYFFDDAYREAQDKIASYQPKFWSVDVRYSRFRQQNEVRFAFGVGPVDGFDQVWYRYRVNGTGGTWSEPSLNARGVLQNLPAFGFATTVYLELQASFDRQTWSNKLVRHPVVIEPALWFTWWGMGLGLLGLLVGVLLIVRFRVNSERKRSDELRKLADALREANSEKERELLERRTLEGELNSIKEKASSLSRELSATEGARDRAAESLEKVERSLIQAEKLSSMGQMIAGVTHELVNPSASMRQSLAPLRGHVESLSRTFENLFDPAEPEALDVKRGLDNELDGIREAVDAADQIAGRILEYSTALRNHARYDSEAPTVFDLATALAESKILLRDRLKNIDLNIHFETETRIEGWLGQMVQVFSNLLINAVDACEAEKIAAKIRVSCRPAIQNGIQGVELHIDDNGPGLRDGSEDRIFEALFTTKPRGVGTGLGLATARQVVKRHEGEIKATNGSVLGGARFIVWLPLKLQKVTRE